MTVIVRDLGLDKILRSVSDLADKGVKVGIQSDAGDHDGVNLVDIAIYNELGTSRIPARPFVRDCLVKNQAAAERVMAHLAQKALQGAPAHDVVATLGEWYQNVQKRHLLTENWTPNAPATIKRKKSSKPLVDTGKMVGAIRWQKL